MIFFKLINRNACCLSLYLLLCGVVIGLTSPIFAKKRSAVPSAEVSKKPVRYVLSIGVENFQNSFWGPLKWTGADAQDFGVTLDDERGTGIKTDILILKNTVTVKQTLQALSKIEQRLRSQDSLIVYLSTHGTLKIDKGEVEPYFVFSDTDPNRLNETGLSRSSLIARIERMHARKKLLVLATCHSGSGKSRLSNEVERFLGQTKGKVAKLENVSRGFLVFTAASSGETALEDNRLKHDLYTYFFLEALNSFDRNGDGSVSAMEAHDYALYKTYERSGGAQRPTMHMQSVGDGDMVLKGRAGKASIPILQAYEANYDGLELGINGRSKGTLPSAFPLRAGSNRIKLFGPKSDEAFAEYEVKAGSNEQIDLEELLRPNPFRVSLIVGAVFNQSERLGDQVRFLGIAGTYRFNRFVTGLTLGLSSQESDEIRKNVNVSYTRPVLQVPLRYGTYFGRNVYLAGGGFVTYQWLTLEIENATTRDSFEIKDSSFGYGVTIESGYEFPNGLNLGIELGYERIKFDYGTYGAIDGSNASLRGVLSYAFGARARRIK